jgi:hypothetical protein
MSAYSYSGDLFVSYWRSNFIGATRIMRHRENATPETVATIPLVGSELADADVLNAEAALRSATSDGMTHNQQGKS